jgi:predicted PurR-regulated permease PerM
MASARRTAILTLAAGGVVVGAIAAWQLRIVLALCFAAVTIAAGMRPGVEALVRRRIPMAVAVFAHFAVAAAVLAAVTALVVPTAIDQIDDAVGLPPQPSKVEQAARRADGIEAGALRAVADSLRRVRKDDDLLGSTLWATRRGLLILGGVAFTFAFSVYWLSERRRLLALAARLVPRDRRRTVLETWEEVERRLGGYLRRVLVMLVVVSIVLSGSYWLLGVPYAIVLGPFSGIVELVPVVGPFIAGAAAVLAALTVSLKLAAEALGVFVAFRLCQDYVINPRWIGGGVGVPPLLVLAFAAAVGLLLGPVAVVVATPLAAVAVTIFEVVVRGRDPRPREDRPPAVRLVRR